MARNVTKAELRGFSANRSQSGREQLIKSNAFSRGTSTFLSHSSKDQELLEGAMEVLYNHGARVYIDEIDPEMPPYTSAETAALLKQRISQTRRFVLLTTENSKDSRWVPWELGIPVVGVRIHNLKCPNAGSGAYGLNPFDYVMLKRANGTVYSPRVYDPRADDAYGSIKANLPAWIETAIKECA